MVAMFHHNQAVIERYLYVETLLDHKEKTDPV